MNKPQINQVIRPTNLVPDILSNEAMKRIGELFTKAHDCEKCHDKIVCIEVDSITGKTYCAYCHQEVDYSEVHNAIREELERWRGLREKTT